MSEHLSDAELRDFATGGLGSEELITADAHLAGCDPCRERAIQVNDAGTYIDDVLAQLTGPAAHLSDDDLQAYLTQQLSPARRDSVEHHLKNCDICAAQVEDLRSWAAPAPTGQRNWLALAAGIVLAIAIPTLVWHARSGRTAMSSSLAGLEILSPDEQARVRAALDSGAVTVPAFLADLTPRRETLMGLSAVGGAAFKLLAPIETATASDRPEFRWEALNGADGYSVTVADEGASVVARSPLVRSTTWTPLEPLASNRTYVWQVTAHRARDTVTVPAAPAPPAKFRVADRRTADALRKIESEHPEAHLLIGLVAMDAGIKDEARTNLEQVPSTDPHADVARRALEQLRAIDSRPQPF